MEEIYIVKLKGLPPPTSTSQESLSKDSKNSFYYQDLTAEAIRGFSYLHIFFGLTVLCLSVTNLCFHENPLALEPPLGITVWCAIAFMLLGIFGIVTAYKRKCDLSKSIFYVKIHFGFIIIVLSMTLSFVVLFAFDLHGPIANQFIGLNIFFSIIVETVILLLTLFTCARVLWPGCMNFCAKDWPMQPKLKRKVIVKTNVFANGIQQDDSSMIQTVGPNCVVSLNMPPLPESSQSTSPSPSSSASSPNSPKGMSNSALSSALSSTTSDLANSSSSLYSIKGEQSGSADEQSNHLGEATITTNTIYHSGICLTSSYPLSSSSTGNNANMQTFQKDPLKRSNQMKLHGNVNRLLYEHSNLFKRRSFLESTSCSFNREYSNGADCDDHSGPDDLDPYDTDEFDYCTTEDEDEEPNRRVYSTDSNKSSSDDGNGTLDEDNKSSVNSDQLSSSHSENDLNDSLEHSHNITHDVEHQMNQSQEKQLDVAIKLDSPNELPNHESSFGQFTNNNQNPSIHTQIGLDSADRLSLPEEDEDEDEQDEGIDSSGSSTCSAELGQTLATPFSNRLRLQTYRSKHPYKSSVKIEANNISNTTSTSCSEDVSPLSTKKCSKTNKAESSHVTSVDQYSSKPSSRDSTTTIRLLTTKSTPCQPKQKLRIDVSGQNRMSVRGIGTAISSSANSKLASHPYLCRLRANNVSTDCFEKRYPKYVSTSTTTSSTGTTGNGAKVAPNITVNYHEPNRIPDIQGV